MKKSSKVEMEDPFKIVSTVQPQDVDDVVWTRLTAKLDKQIQSRVSWRWGWIGLLLLALIFNVSSLLRTRRESTQEPHSITFQYFEFQWNIYE